MTSATDRVDIITNIFDIPTDNIQEGMETNMKLTYLNSIKEKVIYVDDKRSMEWMIENTMCEFINYPKHIMISKSQRSRINSRYR